MANKTKTKKKNQKQNNKNKEYYPIFGQMNYLQIKLRYFQMDAISFLRADSCERTDVR